MALINVMPLAVSIAILSVISKEIGVEVALRLTKRSAALMKALLSDETLTEDQVIAELKQSAKNPDAVDAIIQGMNTLRGVIADESVPPLGVLMREYARIPVKKPDRFFRGLCTVLCDSESSDIDAMRRLFANTTGPVFNEEDPIVFSLSNRDGISVMRSYAVPPPNPALQPVVVVNMDEPDRIAHMLTVHGIARTVKASNKWGASNGPDDFSVPRSDCRRLARILSASE